MRTRRLGLLFALLLVLLGVSAAVTPHSGVGPAGPQLTSLLGAPVLRESVSAAPVMNDDLHDWLRVSMAARCVPAVAVPETWWAVRPHATGGCAQQGRWRLDEAGGTGAAVAESTPRSSRAPPFA
ncbi:hypothetical protein A6A25_30775 [Saccharothrix sp. CB00851]|nr:hypothetical protein A6A25_30775 [Saccharothrix sp. CB00851]